MWWSGKSPGFQCDVYEDGRLVFQCHTPEEAQRIVALLNGAEADKARLDWLEDASDTNPQTAHEFSRHGGHFQVWDGSQWGKFQKTLRAAIDRARQETKEPHE